jgi:hypothetical protein
MASAEPADAAVVGDEETISAAPDDHSSSNANQQTRAKPRKNRRRGKGKSSTAAVKRQHAEEEVPLIVKKVAEEQVENIVSRGLVNACWSLGIILPQHTPRASFGEETPLPEAPPLAGSEAPIDEYIWEDTDIGTLMSMVDKAAHDPVSMESLVQDLALALPEISSEILQRKAGTVGINDGEYTDWSDLTGTTASFLSGASSTAYYDIDSLLQVRFLHYALWNILTKNLGRQTNEN